MGHPIRRRRAGVAAGLLIAALLFPSSVPRAAAEPCVVPDMLTRVSGGDECLIVKTFVHAGEGGPRVLYVLLHGNHSDGSPAVSMVKIAENLAAKAPPGSVAVAVIRPGYDDEQGHYSTGDRNRADNWTAPIVDAIARLKAFHKAQRLVLIGHSGGLAIAGVILGRHPGLADAALLAGCVCNMREWRSGRPGHAWTSESPSDYLARLPPRTRIAVLVGEGDTVTPPRLSRRYVEALGERGFAPEFRVVPGRDHLNIIRSRQLIDTALALGRAE